MKAFDEADAAARKGDQVTYAERITEAGRLAEQLQALRNESEAEGGDGTKTTDTGPTSTTTTSPATTTTTSAGT